MAALFPVENPSFAHSSTGNPSFTVKTKSIPRYFQVFLQSSPDCRMPHRFPTSQYHSLQLRENWFFSKAPLGKDEKEKACDVEQTLRAEDWPKKSLNCRCATTSTCHLPRVRHDWIYILYYYSWNGGNVTLHLPLSFHFLCFADRGLCCRREVLIFSHLDEYHDKTTKKNNLIALIVKSSLIGLTAKTSYSSKMMLQ